MQRAAVEAAVVAVNRQLLEQLEDGSLEQDQGPGERGGQPAIIKEGSDGQTAGARDIQALCAAGSAVNTALGNWARALEEQNAQPEHMADVESAIEAGLYRIIILQDLILLCWLEP